MIKKSHGILNSKFLIKYASIIDIILYFLVVFKVNNISKLIILTWIFYNIDDIKNLKIKMFKETLINTFTKCIISKPEDFNDILYCIDILKESNYISLSQDNTICVNTKKYDIINNNLKKISKNQKKIIDKLIQYDTIVLLKELMHDNYK